MYCDRCGKPATYHRVSIVNGYKTEEHLCSECLSIERGTMPFEVASIGEFFDFPSSLNRRKKKQNLVCPNCGYTSQQFLETGRLGCSECYHAMKSVVDPVINRMIGDQDNDIGKITLRKGQNEIDLPSASVLDSLKEKLKCAVSLENYEEAAILKKQIDSIEKKSGKEDN